MTAFIILCSSTLLLTIAVGIMCRPIIRGVGNYAKTHAEIYAMAYLKASCLMTLAMGGTFKETWQSVTSVQAANWAWWDWAIHLLAPILSGIAVLSAFLDRSMQRADEVKAKVQNGTPPDGSSNSA